MTKQELDAEQKAFIEWYESASNEDQLAATQIIDSLLLEEQSDS